MSKHPTLRSRIWNLLRTAKGERVAVATLAVVLNVAPTTVLAQVMPELLEGEIHCVPGEDGQGLRPENLS